MSTLEQAITGRPDWEQLNNGNGRYTSPRALAGCMDSVEAHVREAVA